MKELKIEVILTSNNQISKEKYLAIEDNNCLSYLENDIKVCLYIGNIIRMTRENDEYLLDFNFVKNQITKAKYILKNINKTIDLEIFTDYIIVEDKLIIIKYKVLPTEQDVIFKLKM